MVAGNVGDHFYVAHMVTNNDNDFSAEDADERELYLRWLRFLRGAVLRKSAEVDEAAAR